MDDPRFRADEQREAEDQSDANAKAAGNHGKISPKTRTSSPSLAAT
jgi:hypothetical protein